ncbi:TetR/AcrR family transcriptional regulator [Methanoculleus sp. Wushi-C6]|uniref:TetR/AcrR family transcriptional regulator n=1 Tax=Methanoculleus caldifontis TaxID=2651577 RepID=A0ABU3X1P5_9EURY|nr:TetR/AcrR family transcriptional regulator [Methanoculleus sp. Wushi-C6]MDV2481876.1 TetR/AcrR family transcriptional regulator [Methanoculleus sp. Wushi-C6]
MPKVVPEYKDEARRRIIEAAIAEADEKGFASLKMEDVAARLGISRATLYLYIKSRDDLVSSALFFIRSQLAGSLEGARSSDTLEGTLSAIFEKIIYPEGGTGMNAVMELFAGAVRDEQLQAAVRKNYRAMHDLIAGTLDEERTAGRLPADLDTDLSAKIIISVALGIRMGAAAGLERDEAERIWDAAVHRILAPRGSPAE